ncbi:OmpA family protein [Undibacterium fentianense]|uniref:OmpA family protein n=1 Tax=Undibacterium fentianense TaxID=2828728 RepID=A0A941DWL7_9BURK|nr:OmpA family protein [Undibacterium fentianense]MBR7798684.1 OmpA family protein [Undibacterium fentianense]
MKKIALAIALIGATTTQVQAQNLELNPSWYIAPNLNYTNTDNRFGLDKDGQGLGLKFGKAINENWDFQIGGIAARTKQSGRTLKQNLLNVDGLYFFNREAVRPFLLIGAGAQEDKLSGTNLSKSATSPFIGIGAGVQANLTEQLALQADIRRNRAQIQGKEFNFNQAYTTYFTVGLNYFFDKVAKPAPVVKAEPAPAPAPVVEPTPVAPPPPAPKFEKYTLSATELFAFDSAVLAAAQPKLDEISKSLKDSPSVNNVTISGFTDRLGSDKYNLKLSEKRANAVRDYLINSGIAASRLNAVGKGESNPVVTCTNKKRVDLIKCLEPNRRVEIEQMTFERRVN